MRRHAHSLRRHIEGQHGKYSASFPDLPGCTAQGETLAEVLVAAREAMLRHVDAIRASGGELPEASSWEELKRRRRGSAAFRSFVIPLAADGEV